MSSNARELAVVLQSIVHQLRGTTDMHQQMHESRVLASVLVQAIQRHSAADIASWIRWRMRTSERSDRRPVSGINEEALNAQLADVRRVRGMAKRKKRHQSQLDPYRAELMALRSSGASWNDLRDWLRRYARLKVNRSTIIRRMNQWMEDGQA
jgi:hypothetical protein